MAKEDERKYLIPNGADIHALVVPGTAPNHIRQVYLTGDKSAVSFNAANHRVTMFDRQQNRSVSLDIPGAANRAALQELLASGLLHGRDDGQDLAMPANLRDQNEVRIRTTDTQGFLTIKRKTHAIGSRDEFEFEIPHDAAMALQKTHIADGTMPIDKTRYSWLQDGVKYELDSYNAENQGLNVVEVELPQLSSDEIYTHEQAEALFATAEQRIRRAYAKAPNITDDKRYGNRGLAQQPYRQWGENMQSIGSSEGGLTPA